MKILAIETSCDETSVAITDGDKLLCNVVSSQVEMHEKYGGVMPEMASRLHSENIGACLKEALHQSKLTFEDIDAFAVTRGPGLIGALHVGVQAAKTLAMLYNKPLIPVHHLAAHVYANEFIGQLEFPLLAVVVSGGNTEFVYMPRHLEFEIIGTTRDDAIGECYDKVARVLDLGYPGGVPIDRLAKTGDKHAYDIPQPLLHDGSYDFSFSGVKTHIINLVHNAKQKGEHINVPDLCASFQYKVMNIIIEKALRAAKEYDVKQVVIAGGVSANSYLRNELPRLLELEGISATIPPLWATTDQAAMIAQLARHLYKEKLFAPLTLGADPNWQIDDFRNF